MKFEVLTLFPELFQNFLDTSIIKIAREKKAIDVRLTDIRGFATDKHRQVDDYPYGGGAGMVLKPEPLYDTIEHVRKPPDIPVIYFTPQGRLLKQSIIEEYRSSEHVVLLCGHYKEIDQRIRDTLVNDEISIGDYVLSGGELPAMVFMDALTRLQDGVLSDIESANTDSHADGLLGCPYYTRPAEFKGLEVPEVLLSGNHEEIRKWRREKSLELTKQVRPDLLKNEK
jgi:tRNA (guanine37-N1)-methyltransferase